MTTRRLRIGPWIWRPSLDLAAFGGSAALGCALVALGHVTGWSDRPMSDVGWLVLVVGFDVAHVWSTLFRTYLDREELARRPGLYGATPIACWLAGVAVHRLSSIAFWRMLAYVAVFHFVRQQVGWAAIYRARAGDSGTLGRRLDNAVLYAATLVPLLIWHARMPRRFVWFVAGDFVSAPSMGTLIAPARVGYAALLAAWVARVAHRAYTERRVEVGKFCMVVGTLATWWVGIVSTNSDFDFTVANVIPHAVPYMVLLWQYARERSVDAPLALGSRIVAGGVAPFVGLLLMLAFVEEGVWDRLVWHDHVTIFGGGDERPGLGAWEAWVVPLLAVPQATHYVLDGLLWRRKDASLAQARALGFASA
jgi:hypothetical protein